MRLVRNEAAAQDLFQAVWIRVMEKEHSFDPARSSFDPWLYAIAHNLAMDFLRRSKFETTGAEAPEPTQPPDAESGLAHASRMAQVRGAIARMDAPQRELLALRFDQEMSLAEIAQVTGTPVATVKTRLHRTLAAVRRLVQ